MSILTRAGCHVAVLMGGWSAEREVSLVSGAAVSKALSEAGYRVSEIDMERDIAARLAALKPDVVFNALHGRWGEDGTVQGLLEIMGIPYTHSGVMASAVAMDKPAAKQLFLDAGIPCAPGVVVSRSELVAHEPMPRPYVVKPLNEGSSVGVVIVQKGDNWTADVARFPTAERLLVEQYIPGREIQVAVMDNKALGAIEIKPKSGFYDYAAKYTAGLADHLMPAPLSDAARALVHDYAERAHKALGCRGVTRSDFRYDEANERFYILETNTQPGMTPLSLVPEIAGDKNISFTDLVCWLVEDAGVER
ncbi:D-alanine--D-alanine ligase [Govanella unica]|uniref:D-alanine--D-alanine ligase n=1 Tax=Govanella unica TaxID=2975056 RepID=A0A9X3TZY1_9PROT|nr:D-alanine--D-alanine ligase [Govania unica]MDA5195081.1 D-alanine--D-alanine ligase [Govania unica]